MVTTTLVRSSFPTTERPFIDRDRRDSYSGDSGCDSAIWRPEVIESVPLLPSGPENGRDDISSFLPKLPFARSFSQTSFEVE